MKKESKNYISSILIVHVISCSVILFLMIYFLIAGAHIETDEFIINTNVRKTYGAGWKNSITGEDIETDSQIRVGNGETLSLEKTLPDILTDDYMIFFYDYGFRISAFADGREIYCQGKDNKNVFGKETGSIWRKIKLTSDMAGRKFSLVLYNDTDTDLHLRLDRLYYGTESYLVGILFASSSWGIAIFTLCIIIAISLAVLAFILWKNKYGIYTKRLFSLAALAVSVGIWVLTDGNVLQVLCTNGSIRFMLSNFSLMLMPLFFNRYCEQNIEADQFVFRMVRNIYEGAMVIMLLLYYFNIIEINQTIFIVYAYIFIEVLLVAHSSLQDYKNRKDISSIGMMMTIPIVGGVTLVVFCLYYFTTKSNYIANVTGIGFIVFFIVMLFTQIRQILMLYAEKKQASNYAALYDAINQLEIDNIENNQEIKDEGITNTDESN